MNFPLSTAFPVPHRFQVVVFSFSLVSMHIFDFFFDLFCHLLVIQQRVVKPPYVGSFNSFSPVIDIYSYCIAEKAMAPHSSTLVWKIPWTEEADRLQSMGSRRVGHD